MEWFTLVSTAVGVLLGVGATNLNERVKWKRDRRKALYESRSKLYSDYLSNLSKTRDAIRIVARGSYPAGLNRSEAADAAFTAHSIYAGRYQIRITAPREVADAAAEALHSTKYNDAKANYETASRVLMETMEKDLTEIR